jgi:hypothetical protein
MAFYEAVKAEAAAVRQLASAITRYAEHLRTAADQARADARQRHQSAEQEAERRRAAMEHARQVLADARLALSRCRRENCGALQQAVNQAQQRFSQAEQQYRAAKRAVGMIVGAEAELLRSVRAAESVIAAHAPTSVKALAALEERIREYDTRRHQSQAAMPRHGHASVLQNVAVTLEVLRGLTGAGHGLAAVNFVPPATASVSISARTEDRDPMGPFEEQYAANELHRLEETNEKLGRKPDGI